MANSYLNFFDVIRPLLFFFVLRIFFIFLDLLYNLDEGSGFVFVRFPRHGTSLLLLRLIAG